MLLTTNNSCSALQNQLLASSYFANQSESSDHNQEYEIVIRHIKESHWFTPVAYPRGGIGGPDPNIILKYGPRYLSKNATKLFMLGAGILYTTD